MTKFLVRYIPRQRLHRAIARIALICPLLSCEFVKFVADLWRSPKFCMRPAMLALLFGDNVYQQLTGRSIYSYQDVPKSEPTVIRIVATVTPTPVPLAASPTAQPPTPTRMPPIATPKPVVSVSLGKITVPGNPEEGIKFTANQQGQYTLRFDLRVGDYLILVASDDQGWYNNPGPNVGEVVNPGLWPVCDRATVGLGHRPATAYPEKLRGYG